MSSIIPKTSSYAKNSINVTYDDNSTQSISFANKTLTVDRGLMVSGNKATLDQGLDVNNVVANLNKGLVVSGAKATLNQGLEVSQNATLNSNLEVKGNSLFNKDVKIDAANLDVVGKVSASELMSANKGLVVKQGLLDAQLGANVTGGMFNAFEGADVRLGLTVSTGDFMAKNGATIKGGQLVAEMGANISGAELIAVKGATVSGAMFNANDGANVKGGLDVAGNFKAHNGLTISNAVLSAEKGATISGGLLVADLGATVNNALFSATKGATISGGLLVASDGANVSGAFNALDGATVNKGLIVNQTATMNNDLSVKANATIENGLVVKGTLTELKAGVQVTGQTLSDTLVVNHNATIKGDMRIDGNLTVLGTQTFVDTQNLQIKDNAMLLADGNVTDAIETGVMMQYKPAGSEKVKYSGMKRIPGTGELIMFKDADNQIGNNDIGNAKAQAEKDSAQVEFDRLKASTQAASDAATLKQYALQDANALVQTRQEAITPYTSALGPDNYDGKADAPGEYVILDFSVQTALTGFKLGVHSGKNSLAKTHFLGSNDKETFHYITDITFQKEIPGSSGNAAQSAVREVNWPSVSYRYLKVVYETLELSIDSPHLCINNVDGTLSGFDFSKITLSSGLTGFMHDNSDMITSQTVPNNIILVSYTSGLYLNNLPSLIGIYKGLLKSAIMHVTDKYNAWYSANATKIGLLNQAKTDAATAKREFDAAFQLWYDNNQLLNGPDGLSGAKGVLNLKVSELARLVPNVYATVVADRFDCHSDRRLKKDIVELNGALDKLDAIRGVSYNWIAESMPEHQVGVIAQEIQSVYPELVREGGNGFLSVDYPKLTAVLIQALKELKALVLSK